MMPRASEKNSTTDAFLTIRVPAELLLELQRDAEKEDRTVAATVRRALREYLEQRDVG